MVSTNKLLRIDSSANIAASSSRKLGDYYVSQWLAVSPDAQIINRDLSNALPQLSQEWLQASVTADSERDEAQQQIMLLSNQLIEELKQADEILITVPMYNFSIPSSLKAWIDLVCRAGETFEYTENGPRGLLDAKPVNVIVTTGGVPIQSPMDFLTNYMKQVMGFIGLTDISIIAADQMNVDADNSYSSAISAIDGQFQQYAQTA